ncbi:MAG: hypothetical protein ACLGSH_06525 [Acidobacteriota bacterium]
MRVQFTFVNQVHGEIVLDGSKVSVLDQVLLDDPTSAIYALETSPARSVLLRAAPGTRIFSAGHNVKERSLNCDYAFPSSNPLRPAARMPVTESEPSTDTLPP